MLKLKVLLSLLLLLALHESLLCQSLSFDNAGFSAKMHYGFIVVNHPMMAHLATQHVTGVEGELSFKSKEDKYWKVKYDSPETGLLVQYYFMDPDKPVGNPLVIMPFIRKFIFRKKNHSLGIRPAGGITYMEKRFSVPDNSSNVVISTRITVALGLELQYRRRIHKNLYINTGLSWLHASNGAIKLPNQGINIPSVHVGLEYVSDYTPDRPTGLPESEKEFEKWTTHIVPSSGIVRRYPVEGPAFFFFAFSGYESYRLNYKSSLTAGIDYWYTPYLDYLLQPDEVNFGNLSRIAVHLGHELRIGNAGFLTQLGIYIHDPIGFYKGYYQRFALKYYFLKNVYIQGALKTHLGSAEFIEWGLGVRL